MNDLRYFLDGPGESLIVDPSYLDNPDPSKLICVVSAKNAAFRSGVTEEKVTGGRSLFPRRKFLTDREVTFELTDCEMDFRYIALSQGADIEEVTTGGSVSFESWAFGEDEQYAIPNTGTALAPEYGPVTLHHTPVESTLVIQTLDGEAIDEDDYTLADDVITFSTPPASLEFRAFYKFNAPAASREVSTKVDSLPKTVAIIHHQPTFDEDNNRTGTQEIEIFKAQVSGEFEEAYEEKSPFAPNLKFELVDPKRVDKRVVAHRFIPLPDEGDESTGTGTGTSTGTGTP